MPKILIVDDEHNTREALARCLRSRFDVTTAADGGAAIELLKENEFDLVLTDLRMPNADGMSVLEASQSKAGRPPCILLTAYGSIDDAVAAVKKGAFDFVQKPVKLDRLDAVVDAALASRKAAEPEAKKENAKAAASPAMAKVYATVETVAPSRSTVLVTGESGTGKEVIARLIHDRSGRSGYFVPVHCAALTSTLLESELFGYEKGAFTGAAERRKGRFELADKGTIFLDEIGEIDAATQVKLLRVLESRSFERVGGMETVKVDVRLIAATNRDLRKMVAEGTFREDLFYRLSVVNLELPPLRERREEIPGLIAGFVAEFAAENSRPAPEITQAAVDELASLRWPGNIRELRNCIECMVVLAHSGKLDVADIPGSVRHEETAAGTEKTEEKEAPVRLEENELQLIEQALRACNGNRTQAAKQLGISRRTLHRKLAAHRELGL